MNRGSQGTHLGSERSRVRFNEAPIHESGKCAQSVQSSIRPCSFNEAPIHESGKAVRAYALAHRAKGFNEAPIHESGKFRTFFVEVPEAGLLQ